RLRRRRGDVPRRLDGPRAELARPDLDAGQDARPRPRLHLGAGDAAPAALRPADEPRLEGAAAPRHSQRPRHGRPGGDDMTGETFSPPMAGTTRCTQEWARLALSPETFSP